MIVRSLYRARHRAYLRSDAWGELRFAALQRDGFRCVACGAKRRLEVHHHRYPRPWERDGLHNVEVLCRPCHQSVHGFDMRLTIRDAIMALVLVAAVAYWLIW